MTAVLIQRLSGKSAERMAKITDADSGILYDNAIAAAVKEVSSKGHLILCAVERYVRNQVFSGLPSRADMALKKMNNYQGGFS